MNVSNHKDVQEDRLIRRTFEAFKSYLAKYTMDRKADRKIVSTIFQEKYYKEITSKSI